MLHRYITLVATCLLLASHSLFAKDSLPKQIVVEPFQGVYDRQTGGLDWTGLAIIGATGYSALLAKAWADNPWKVTTHDRPLLGKTSSLLSNATYPFSAIFVPFLAVGYFSNREHPFENRTFQTGQQMVESLVMTGALSLALKYIVDRERPDGSNFHSFPSNHTAFAFATATTLALRYPWYIGAPSLAFASAVGVSRVDLGQHFVSDVVTGAGMGAFFSYTVYRYHLHQDSENSKTSLWIPSVGPHSVGLSWLKTF